MQNQAQELQDELAKTKAELGKLKAEQHQHKQQHALQCKTLLLSRLCRTADAQASDTDNLQVTLQRLCHS